MLVSAMIDSAIIDSDVRISAMLASAIIDSAVRVSAMLASAIINSALESQADVKIQQNKTYEIRGECRGA